MTAHANSPLQFFFEPDPQSLRLMAGLARGQPWSAAEAVMADFSAKGFSAPQPDPDSPTEFTQSLAPGTEPAEGSSGEEGEKVAMLYASQDQDGLFFSCALSWTILSGLKATDIGGVAHGLLSRMEAVFGQPKAMIPQVANVAEWDRSGPPASSTDVVVLLCFWTPSGADNAPTDVTDVTRVHKSTSAYRDDLCTQSRALTLAISVSQDSAALGEVRTWSAQALVLV